ncbi:16S rRNA (guanine(966)-N(2))-methyltransferase RsmD [Psychroflexus sp. ALD_RP9]|uniref:16S rRNA (guanine(966)-N(2))-methyltransferase RsmD n=1 Tax=Psychroflexus sp. ALD_RP9 TaxID=2777186 RepID=UPI001A8F0702|nr:16S rRNA (guanine(966)-N(2))-methyltransferase RsmD [Psychroflexus sp. ALD_RP9]QSS97461.1 16S rRNA (guanine(966)-N(2))-methyltransferase RsmD [Psychroflexus sp. ALD_RP9]
MRIISGIHKGRRLSAPKNLPVRPTTDRAKEALFNILMHRFSLAEIRLLDLFAGIGSISFEFASRGTQQVTCVDNNSKCCNWLIKTSENLKFNCNVVKKDVFEFIKQTPQKFDVIFADPPYDITKEKLEEMINITFERELLQSEEGLLIIEHSKFINFNEYPKFTEERRYGLSTFSFFNR